MLFEGAKNLVSCSSSTQGERQPTLPSQEDLVADESLVASSEMMVPDTSVRGRGFRSL